MAFPYIENLLIFGSIFSILSVSLNLSMGYTGLFNLGHAAFFAIGAYASALLVLSFGLPFWIAILAAGLFSAFFGFVWDVVALWLNIWPYGAGTLGITLRSLPIEEFIFIFFTPLLIACAAIFLRDRLNVK